QADPDGVIDMLHSVRRQRAYASPQSSLVDRANLIQSHLGVTRDACLTLKNADLETVDSLHARAGQGSDGHSTRMLVPHVVRNDHNRPSLRHFAADRGIEISPVDFPPSRKVYSCHSGQPSRSTASQSAIISSRS